MGDFPPGNQHAAWVAVFVLTIIWLLTTIPKLWVSTLKVRQDETVKFSRAHKAYATARDGVLLLTASTAVSFAGHAAKGATIALSYVFLADWIILIGLTYFMDSKKALNSLKIVGFLLLLANMIQTWGSSKTLYEHNYNNS